MGRRNSADWRGRDEEKELNDMIEALGDMIRMGGGISHCHASSQRVEESCSHSRKSV